MLLCPISSWMSFRSSGTLRACNVFSMWGLIASAAARLIVKVGDKAFEAHSKSKPGAQTSFLERGLEAFPPEVARLIVSGRQRKPSKSWKCWNCNQQFSALDNSPVSEGWWSSRENQIQPQPWTCPTCGIWSLTTPD